MPMQYRKLGKTGLQVSEIGFGGIPIQRVPLEEAVSIVRKAYQLGINFFDTARGYTDSEEKIGRALKSLPRDKIILATKSRLRNKKALREDIHKSLHFFRTDFIDLYQLHNVSNEEELELIFEEGAVEALGDARKEGKIRFAGFSSHNAEIAVKALQRERFDTVQFPFNAVEPEALEELIPLAQKTGVGTIVMKPLCGGVLEDKAKALQYLLGYPISTIIPGMQTVEEVSKNAAVSGMPPLTDKEKEALYAEAKELGNKFCRRCEYCLPCPEDINIPFNFLMLGYYKRYGLHEWAHERYHSQEVTASACQDCGLCEERCPYHLPVREMLQECRDLFE